MKVQGILRNKIVKNYNIERLELLEGVYKDKNIKLYKEYIDNNLALKIYILKDKLGKYLGFRILHIDNGKITKRLDSFV